MQSGNATHFHPSYLCCILLVTMYSLDPSCLASYLIQMTGPLASLVGNHVLTCNKLPARHVASCTCFGRRYLMCENDDQVKLLLETVQMSVSSCMQHPELPTLRPQMVGRLMAAHHSSRVSVCALDLLSPGNQASSCRVLIWV